MNTLLIATRSADKVEEIKRVLSEAGVAAELKSLDEARIRWSSKEDAIESHDSFQGNARAKAEYFAKLSGLPTVADDSGLEVLSLLGRPGVKSKRFAPQAGSLTGKELDAANNAELLSQLLGADATRRRACYVCVAVLLRRQSAPPESFTGRCWGRILEAPQGDGGFGYDPLFFDETLGRTFAELTIEEKLQVNHRGQAFRDLAKALLARPLV